MFKPGTYSKKDEGQIAEALSVSKGAVSQWMTRAQAEGSEALRQRPPFGPRGD